MRPWDKTRLYFSRFMNQFFVIFFIFARNVFAFTDSSESCRLSDDLISSFSRSSYQLFQGCSRSFPVIDSKHCSTNATFESWINSEKSASIQGLLMNVSPEGVTRGVVTASPSRSDPDYFFHWVRDASLVMSAVIDLYEDSLSASRKREYERLLEDFVDFSRKNQLTQNLSGGLGEPKFNVDGTAYSLEWGRPQNDGPALRALTLIRFARIRLAQGAIDWVRVRLYDGLIPTHSVIKSDLEFISHHWREHSFDVWEEVKGQHFYTQMVQRRALLEGAALADDLKDFQAAKWYRKQAQALEAQILKYWDDSRKYIQVTRDDSGGISTKVSGLDVAVILGCLHGYANDDFFSFSDDRVISTADVLRQAFDQLYTINRDSSLGTAIGRYPEDVYDGHSVGVNAGNPWVLATLGYAELYSRIAQDFFRRNQIRVTTLNLPFFQSLDGIQSLGVSLRVGIVFKKGGGIFETLLTLIQKNAHHYLKRVQYHSPLSGSLSEQMNRNTGFMQGARDLAWSYASFLTAIQEREKLARLLSPD